MAQKAKSRRPGVKRAAVTPPHNNPSNGSTNGFHKAEPPPLLGENHPLAKVAGSFKDDPFWDEFIQLMKEARREEDDRYFKEADLGGQDTNGTTPLMAAAVSGSLPTVQLLLDHDADPNARNNDDLTAAAIAAYLKKPAVAALLRKAGGGE